MTDNMKKEPAWKTLGFKSELEYRKHLGKQKHTAQERGFIPYAEYHKNLAKDKLNKLIQELEESTESCSVLMPYYVPVVIRHLNTEIQKDDIDRDTYHSMLKRIESSAKEFEKKCNCSGSTNASIRDKHSEEVTNRLKLLKESVESCRTDSPSMSFMASKSLGAYDGYVHNGKPLLSKGLMEILNIAVEFKGCSCKRKDRIY